MRIYLGGHLNFYHPQKDKWLEIKLQQPTRLADILASSDIPSGEVYLAAVNGEQVDLLTAIVEEQDEVRLFPPVGGGLEIATTQEKHPSFTMTISKVSCEAGHILQGNNE